MTLKYLGVFPEHMYRGKKYERYFHHQEIIRGRAVNFYEIIEREEVSTDVSISQAKKYNKLFLETT